MKKNILIVTGGAGFVGANLISLLVKKTNYRVISIDNYFSGNKKNHIKNKNVKYIIGDTKNISNILKKYKKKINAVFHFGEFSRIAQSFKNFNVCLDSNIEGTNNVIKFCLKNKIKIIYSSTSASLGNDQTDQHLSPYAFTKSYNMNLIMNLNQWFNFKYEIIYFYNVYGKRHITKNNNMAAVVGIFENSYIQKKPLPVVRPGTQSRKFTNVIDTVKTCYYAYKKNKNSHYSISSNKHYKIKDLAKLFSKNIKFVPTRRGERFESKLTKSIRGKKIINLKSNMSLEKYIKDFKKNIDKQNLKLK